MLDDLIELFRCAMIMSMTANIDGITLLPATRQWLKEVKGSADSVRWQGILDKLLNIAQTVKYATHPWLQLEVNLLELCTIEQADTTALVKRIAMLEGQVAQLLNGDRPSKQPLPVSVQKSEAQLKAVSAVPPSQVQLPEEVATPIEVAPQQSVQTVAQLASHALTLEDIIDNWQALMEQLKSILPTTFALMKKVEPVAYHDGKLVLQIDASVKVLKPTIMKNDNINNIKKAFQKTFNSDVQVDVVDADCDRVGAVRAYFKGVVDDANIIIE